MTSSQRVGLIAFVFTVGLSWVTGAQAPAEKPPAVEAPAVKPPTPLTDLQKLTLVNQSQAVEIAQLKLQQAATDFQRAKETFEKALAAVQVPGYDLDPQLNYVKKPDVKK